MAISIPEQLTTTSQSGKIVDATNSIDETFRRNVPSTVGEVLNILGSDDGNGIAQDRINLFLLKAYQSGFDAWIGTKAEYEELVAAGQIDENTWYYITDEYARWSEITEKPSIRIIIDGNIVTATEQNGHIDADITSILPISMWDEYNL